MCDMRCVLCDRFSTGRFQQNQRQKKRLRTQGLLSTLCTLQLCAQLPFLLRRRDNSLDLFPLEFFFFLINQSGFRYRSQLVPLFPNDNCELKIDELCSDYHWHTCLFLLLSLPLLMNTDSTRIPPNQFTWLALCLVYSSGSCWFVTETVVR